MSSRLKQTVICASLFFLLVTYQNCGDHTMIPRFAGRSQTVASVNKGVQFTIQPTSIDFGKVILHNSISYPVTVTNNSSVNSLTLRLPNSQGSYVFSQNTCETIPPQNTCSFFVTYKPTQSISESLSALVFASAAGEEASLVLALGGQGFFIAPSFNDLAPLQLGLGRSIASLPQFAPNVVKGYAYDNLTGKVIQNAQVVVSCGAFENGVAFSDTFGFFSIQNLPDGQCQVSLSAPNYVTRRENVILDHLSSSSSIFDFSRGL